MCIIPAAAKLHTYLQSNLLIAHTAEQTWSSSGELSLQRDQRGGSFSWSRCVFPWPPLHLGRGPSFPARQRHNRVTVNMIARTVSGVSRGIHRAEEKARDRVQASIPLCLASRHPLCAVHSNLTQLQKPEYLRKHTHRFFLWIYLMNITWHY